MGTAPSQSFTYIVAQVQSEFDPAFVRSRVDAFFDEHFAWLEDGVKEEEFQTCLRGVLSELKMKPKNLSEEFGRFQTAFIKRSYDFDRKVHNIDMYALAKVLGDEDAANRARVFVQEMFGFNTRYPQSFAMGTDGEVPCDVTFMKTAVPADGVFWNLLAGAEPAKERKTAAVAAALQSIEDEGLLTWDEDVIGNSTGGRPENLRGMRFSNWGNGVQWENTAAAVMALLQSHEEFEDGLSQVELREEIDHMRGS
ncbi:DEGP1, partial [Symbiodinium microadriaticum]